MRKWTIYLFAGLIAASMLVFVACDDEPTQEEANQQFCDDVGELLASLRSVRDLDSDSTIEEIDQARQRVRDAYASVLESAAGVVDARLDELQDSYGELQQAVDDLEDDATLEDALAEVDDEIENVALEASQILNDVDCGGAGSGGQSDE